jgi:nucleoid DNA-binding protein
MNKGDLAAAVADRTGMPKQAANQAVEAVFACIGEALKRGEEVRVPGFGNFASTGAEPAPDAIHRPVRRCRSRRPIRRNSRPARA